MSTPSPSPTARWGLVATIKAPLDEILGFAAHHLDLGAHRLFIFLDDADERARETLAAHPRIRVFACDAAHWRRLGRKRPAKHQVRQSANATFAYERAGQVDWLIHMDVDEFLWPEGDGVTAQLAALADDTLCARVRPVEQLCGDGTLFKAFIPPGPEREAIVARLYPRFGRYVKGGFLSHLAGKLFVRTGLGPLRIRIHNIFRGDEMNPGEVEMDHMALCHCHAGSWEQWVAAYRYRLEKGSYRADLAPARPREKGGLTLHEVLTAIEADSGEAGLRAFFDEIGAADADVRQRLRSAGLLRHCDLELARKRRKHFPGID